MISENMVAVMVPNIRVGTALYISITVCAVLRFNPVYCMLKKCVN
jgi:hypothetical protein